MIKPQILFLNLAQSRQHGVKYQLFQGRPAISPDEVEDVAFDDAPWIKKGRKGTRYLLGYTVAGRYLFTVYTLKNKGIAKVITSMDMDDNTGKPYRKRGK